MIDICRKITSEYQAQFVSIPVSENAQKLGMSAIEFVCLSDDVFMAVVRAHPLESLALISQGDEDVQEVGTARVPPDVWAQTTAFMLGFEVDDWYLGLSKKDRDGFLDIMPDVSRRELNRLTPDEIEEYFTQIVLGVPHKKAHAFVLVCRPEELAKALARRDAQAEDAA